MDRFAPFSCHETTTDFGKIGTSFTSKDKEEFGKFMSSGSGGSLDESKRPLGISLADLGQELADGVKRKKFRKK